METGSLKKLFIFLHPSIWESQHVVLDGTVVLSGIRLIDPLVANDLLMCLIGVADLFAFRRPAFLLAAWLRSPAVPSGRAGGSLTRSYCVAQQHRVFYPPKKLVWKRNLEWASRLQSWCHLIFFLFNSRINLLIIDLEFNWSQNRCCSRVIYFKITDLKVNEFKWEAVIKMLSVKNYKYFFSYSTFTTLKKPGVCRLQGIWFLVVKNSTAVTESPRDLY